MSAVPDATLTLTDTPLAGVRLVQRRRHHDERGGFARLFCRDTLAAEGGFDVVQVNHSTTRYRGTVRGLHFQHPPHAEAKLVSCVAGRVFDVAVDLRRGSPTFLHWWACELSPENGLALWIPPGCAHGFQALEDHSALIYLHSRAYVPEAEGVIPVEEPRLHPGPVTWPLPVQGLSPRDARATPLDNHFAGLSP